MLTTVSLGDQASYHSPTVREFMLSRARNQIEYANILLLLNRKKKKKKVKKTLKIFKSRGVIKSLKSV